MMAGSSFSLGQGVWYRRAIMDIGAETGASGGTMAPLRAGRRPGAAA